MTKKRNVNLDGLKLLACFAVIGLHRSEERRVGKEWR